MKKFMTNKFNWLEMQQIALVLAVAAISADGFDLDELTDEQQKEYADKAVETLKLAMDATCQ